MFSNSVLRPLGVLRRKLGVPSDSRLDSVALNLSQLLIITVLIKIDACPTAEQSQGTLGRGVLAVLGVFSLCLLFCPSKNRGDQSQNLDLVPVSAELSTS